MIDQYTGKKIISPLDLPIIEEIVSPTMLGEIETIRLVADRNFSPGCDIVIRFKCFDGVSHDLRFSLRITGEPDTPDVIKKSSVLIGFPVLGDEVQEINSVQLSLSRSSSVSEFLSNLSAHIASLSEVVDSNSGLKPAKKIF